MMTFSINLSRKKNNTNLFFVLDLSMVFPMILNCLFTLRQQTDKSKIRIVTQFYSIINDFFLEESQNQKNGDPKAIKRIL
jgi:ActR/RegA family two-component response regulator